MKNILITLCILSFSLITSVQAQSSSPKKPKYVPANIIKDVKKEAKKYTKDGYKVMPGNLPIEQQLNAAYIKQQEVDKEGVPVWITANGSSTAQTQAVAENSAIEIAKINLVGLIETNMRSVIEADLGNNQIDNETAASITKTLSVSSNKVFKKLGLVKPLFKVYREVGDKNTEVQVLIGYNYEYVKRQILEEMKLDLEKTSADVREKNDKFLNPEYYNR
jgi:hypothetical protein